MSRSSHRGARAATRALRTATRALRAATIALVATPLLLACSGPKGDQYRTVKSYEFASCESQPTSDATELELSRRFREDLGIHYLRLSGDTIFAANHERSAGESGVREYRGPFYYYVHPAKLEYEDERARVERKYLLYLHAHEVRFRANGADWGEWQKVRTRNFSGVNTRSVEGMGRWKCLVGAEIAWASATLRNGQWKIRIEGGGPYDGDELWRLDPPPSAAQIEGTEDVAPGTEPPPVAAGEQP
ncbi:MAG: hypothetical protein U1F11_03060 [Steroidobacteraceae bacterium]